MSDIVTLVQKLNSSISSAIRVCMPGTIESYDFKAQKANVKISMKELYTNGKELDYPVVNNVPVVFMAAGGASITLPVNKGDSCLLIFADRDMSNWLLGGIGQKPSSTRMHNLSDAIAIMGLQPFTKVGGAKNNDDLAINYADASITITKSGDINITTKKGVNVSSVEDINLNSKNINITATENVNIKSSQITNIEALKDITITSSENINIKSTQTTNVEALQDLNIKAAATTNVRALDLNIATTNSANITSKDISITASNEIKTSAVKFIHTGNFLVSGNFELAGIGSGANGGAITFKGGINNTGDIINNGKFNNTGDISNTGNIHNTGDITATGAVKSGSVTLSTHTHSYSQPVIGSTPTAATPAFTGAPT